MVDRELFTSLLGYYVVLIFKDFDSRCDGMDRALSDYFSIDLQRQLQQLQRNYQFHQHEYKMLESQPRG